MSMPESYRHSFIAGLHNALSGFTGTDVDEAVRFSEQAKTKCVGITIETRPDYCLRPHLRCVFFTTSFFLPLLSPPSLTLPLPPPPPPSGWFCC